MILTISHNTSSSRRQGEGQGRAHMCHVLLHYNMIHTLFISIQTDRIIHDDSRRQGEGQGQAQGQGQGQGARGADMYN